VEARIAGPLRALLCEGDLAWHHPWRYEVALHLARVLLTGPDTSRNIESLRTQDERYDLWRYDFERTLDFDHELLAGAPQPAQEMAGRGGAVVWRARRRLALKAIVDWIITPAAASQIDVDPPGWRLMIPDTWKCVYPGIEGGLPGTVMADLADGKVIAVRDGDRMAVWPYDEKTNAPVRDFDVVLDALGELEPASVIELILLDDGISTLYIPAPTAHELGFITASERDHIIAQAEEKTARNVAAALKRARKSCRQDEYDELVALQDDPEQLLKLAAEHYIQYHVVRPWWEWEAGTTVEELLRLDARPDRLTCLIQTRARYRQRILEIKMEQAGRRAVVLGDTDPDDDAGTFDPADIDWLELFDS
jgi:hypothetical protein